MAYTLTIILAILFFIVSIVVIIFAVIQSQIGKKSDIPPNSSHVLNLVKRDMTGGHQVLLVKKKGERPNKNDTVTFTMRPVDIRQGDEEDEKIIPADESVVVHKEDIVRIPNFHGRELIIFLPRSELDLPKELRGTTLGEALAKKGQDSWLIKGVIELVRRGDLSVAEINKHTNRGNISHQYISQVQEQIMKMAELNALKQEKDEKKKTEE